MKIVFIGGRNIHQLGGIETYMRNLATELVKIGYTPIVYCESDHNGEEWFNGFLVIHQKSLKSNLFCKPFLGLKATLHSLIRNKDVDVYHYNVWPALWGWIPRLFGKLSLMQGHGFEWKRTKYSLFQRKIIKFMEYLMIHINKYVILVSQEQTDYFLSHYNKICTTIPSGVYLPAAVIQSNICKKFNIAKNNYFLFLGRLVQEKNPDILIKAFIYAKIKDKKLVLAGSNEQKPEYEEKLHQLANNVDNIIFTGSVYGDDKESLLQNCFVFCIPSTIEGLSITLLEAMSYGKPILASDILSNREALGDSGIWVKPEDMNDLSNKLVYCLEHVEEIKKQKLYNYQRIVQNYTWDIIVKKYITYLHTILSEKNNP